MGVIALEAKEARMGTHGRRHRFVSPLGRAIVAAIKQHANDADLFTRQ